MAAVYGQGHQTVADGRAANEEDRYGRSWLASPEGESRVLREKREILETSLGLWSRPTCAPESPGPTLRGPGCGRPLAGDITNPLENRVRGWPSHVSVVTLARRSRLGKYSSAPKRRQSNQFSTINPHAAGISGGRVLSAATRRSSNRAAACSGSPPSTSGVSRRRSAPSTDVWLLASAKHRP